MEFKGVTGGKIIQKVADGNTGDIVNYDIVASAPFILYLQQFLSN